MQNWMAVYVRDKHRTTVTLALVWSHEKDEYDLASERTWFHDPDRDPERSKQEALDAITYVKALCEKHSKIYDVNEQIHDVAGVTIHTGLLD